MKLSFMFLVTVSSRVFASEVTQRIENPQYDYETLKKMETAQQLMDDFLMNEKSLRSFSTAEQPTRIEELSFNEDNLDISLKNLEMVAEDATIGAVAEQPLQTLKLELTVGKVFIHGTSILKSESTQSQSNFKFMMQNILCSGTGSIVMNNGEIDCEWVLFNCSEPLGVIISNSLKESGLNKKGNFENTEEGLLRTVETNLNELCTLRLKNALRQSPSRLKNLLNNILNSKMAQSQELDSNQLMDAAISVISYYIQENYNDSIKLPDIRKAIPCSVLYFLRCDTGLIAQNGSAKHVSDLERVGNARITRRNQTVDFTGNVKFEKLLIHYDKYKASLLGIGPSGNLKLQSQPVVVGIQLEINFGNRKITLKKLKIKKLGFTQVQLSGLGIILGRAVTHITPYFVGIFNAQISWIVEKKVTDYARDALKKKSIDDLY